jgi:hypothetical protein
MEINEIKQNIDKGVDLFHLFGTNSKSIQRHLFQHGQSQVVPERDAR